MATKMNLQKFVKSTSPETEKKEYCEIIDSQ